MGLSCDCGFDVCLDDYAWIWYGPDGYTELSTKRSRKCCSCGTKISVGETCAAFPRERATNSEIEERIYGEGEPVPIATWWHCETCADLYFSITELGYCISLEDNMHDLVKEYADSQKARAA